MQQDAQEFITALLTALSSQTRTWPNSVCASHLLCYACAIPDRDLDYAWAL